MSTLLEENLNPVVGKLLNPSINTPSNPSLQHNMKTRSNLFGAEKNAKGKFHFKIRKMFLNGNIHYVYIGVHTLVFHTLLGIQGNLTVLDH